MITCSSTIDFKRAISSLPDNCEIGFVPTMGALHEGHISLIKTALKYTDTVVVSIFVNPTQFNNPEDLKKYPRTLEQDCKKLEETNVSILFAPSVEDIYPEPDTRIFDFGTLDAIGEGPRRPGHFNGVAQVITKLFDIVRPKYAFFGEKDYQQLAIVKYFTKQLGYPVQIIACPILREDDGLAMSSRNTLLTPEQRKAAPLIYQALLNAATLAKEDKIPPKELLKLTINKINNSPQLEVEYVEIVDSATLQPVPRWDDAENIQMWTAVFAGNTRLIDNIKLK